MEKLEVIGADRSTRMTNLSDPQPTAPTEGAPSVAPPPADRPSSASTPDTKKAYEALAAVESLQTQLMYVHFLTHFTFSLRINFPDYIIDVIVA